MTEVTVCHVSACTMLNSFTTKGHPLGDHFAVQFDTVFRKLRSVTKHVAYRKTKDIDIEQFKKDISARLSSSGTLQELVDT